MADTLVAGWKTSRRLWRAWASLTSLVIAYQLVLGLFLYVPGWSPAALPCPSPLSLSCGLEGMHDVAISTLSLVALGAVILLCCRYRAIVMSDPPSVLHRFACERYCIYAVAIACVVCLILRAVPPLINSVLTELHHHAMGDMELRLWWRDRLWLWLLISHWLPELPPVVGLLLLLRALDTPTLSRHPCSSSLASPLTTSTPPLLPLSPTLSRLLSHPPNSLAPSNLTPSLAPSTISRPQLQAASVQASLSSSLVDAPASGRVTAQRRTQHNTSVQVDYAHVGLGGPSPRRGFRRASTASELSTDGAEAVAEAPCGLYLTESLLEGRYTWCVPHAWLEMVLRERDKQLAEMTMLLQEAEAREGLRLEGETSLLDRLRNELQPEPRKSELSWRRIEHHRLHEAIADSRPLLALLGRGSYRHLAFKPSTYKAEPLLRFVPTNLHLQTMTVYPAKAITHPHIDAYEPPEPSDTTGIASIASSSAAASTATASGSATRPLPAAPTDGTSLAAYATVTVGAPAAHALGFKSGGIWQLQQRLAKCQHELQATCDEEHRVYLSRKAERLRAECSEREEVHATPPPSSPTQLAYPARLPASHIRLAPVSRPASPVRRTSAGVCEPGSRQPHLRIHAYTAARGRRRGACREPPSRRDCSRAVVPHRGASGLGVTALHLRQGGAHARRCPRGDPILDGLRPLLRLST